MIRGNVGLPVLDVRKAWIGYSIAITKAILICEFVNNLIEVPALTEHI
jgi:hypothetical protein